MAKTAKSAVYSAKAAQIAAKMLRSQIAYEKAVADCDVNKITGSERAGLVAFAATAMHDTQFRGAIAKAILTPGVSATYTFKEIAKKAKVNIGDISKVNLRYIAQNVQRRVALVGFSVDFDWEGETVTVRKAAAKTASKPRKAKAKTPTATPLESPENVA